MHMRTKDVGVASKGSLLKKADGGVPPQCGPRKVEVVVVVAAVVVVVVVVVAVAVAVAVAVVVVAVVVVVVKGSLGGETSVLRTFRMSGKELVKERVSKERVSQRNS